ncbi:MAG: protein-disulfide reductase DsbD N-terminal domain-containing protein [Gammaproteobacteria bacterium]|nr:protein-disulfide reductase DsbD N-terminal domain-containing protein [Gammaproteobacteria bacterium]
MVKPFLKYLVLLRLLQSGFAQAVGGEPLSPDEAFKFKISVKGPHTLIAEFLPAKDHYIYKDKVRFAVKNQGGVLIRQIHMPAGKIKNDRFLGTMEVYKEPFQAELVLDRSLKAKKITLLATYQGCNEKLGLCYSPIEKSVGLVLP